MQQNYLSVQLLINFLAKVFVEKMRFLYFFGAKPRMFFLHIFEDISAKNQYFKKK
jgi:hypothetical protein